MSKSAKNKKVLNTAIFVIDSLTLNILTFYPSHTSPQQTKSNNWDICLARRGTNITFCRAIMERSGCFEQQPTRSEIESLLNTFDINRPVSDSCDDRYTIKLQDQKLYKRLCTYKISLYVLFCIHSYCYF